MLWCDNLRCVNVAVVYCGYCRITYCDVCATGRYGVRWGSKQYRQWSCFSRYHAYVDVKTLNAVIPAEQTCPTCHITKPLDYFGARRKSRPAGMFITRRHICRECDKDERKGRLKTSIEQGLAQRCRVCKRYKKVEWFAGRSSICLTCEEKKELTSLHICTRCRKKRPGAKFLVPEAGQICQKCRPFQYCSVCDTNRVMEYFPNKGRRKRICYPCQTLNRRGQFGGKIACRFCGKVNPAHNYITPAYRCVACSAGDVSRRELALREGLYIPSPANLADKLLEKQGCKCLGCKKPFGEGRPPELDHIWPILQYKWDCEVNFQLLCRNCNASKSDKDPVSWQKAKGLKLGTYYRHIKTECRRLQKEQAESGGRPRYRQKRL